jgi:NADP-dependent 3-hydroxy acid dehydrogenase YdfG
MPSGTDFESVLSRSVVSFWRRWLHLNNAGAGYLSNIDALSLEQWHQMINTNLNGTFYMTSKVVPLMKENQATCHIINVGSVLGKITNSESAAYSATKYGLQGFSEALFKELRSHKIKVTCVNPGNIDTRFFEDSGVEPHQNMLQPNDIAALVIHILETPDNLLVDEMSLRPLIPDPPQKPHRLNLWPDQSGLRRCIAVSVSRAPKAAHD